VKQLLKHLRDRIRGSVPKGSKRSNKWPKIRATHLSKNGRCAVCKGTKKLEVHHIKPFHMAPDLELKVSNLVTLCESKKGGLNCHLAVGHLGSYKRVNFKVKADILYWSNRIKRF
jgi:5-methylcytosine-specific restriction endonuclease McrA